MLQIEHIYEFFYENVFKDCVVVSALRGVYPRQWQFFSKDVKYYTNHTLAQKLKNIEEDIRKGHYKQSLFKNKTIMFHDQEPVDQNIVLPYIDQASLNPHQITIVTSEKSKDSNDWPRPSINVLYYFFHGFAALDWYRGYYAMNYAQPVIKDYKYNFITFNRIVTGDRAYRKTFVDKLKENNLIDQGLISYGVVDEPNTDDRLVIDHDQVSASASADIVRTINAVDCPDYSAFWHIVTETVFYYDKLHLTEKIFKPIVSKQPFMLLAAPGNLAYLKSYGFKTFDSVIDESYDTIKDNDARIDTVVAQMKWYCNLSQKEKSRVIERLAPIVEYNFQHFYGKFKHIIANELLTNCQTLFKEVSYDDSHINYFALNRLLTT